MTVQSKDKIVGEIDRFLQEALAQMPAEPPATAGRPRVLPALCLWAGLLICVLRGFTSQAALWRLLSQKGLWYFPRFSVSDQAIYKRLAQAGVAPLVALFEQISTLLYQRLLPFAAPLAPFASGVYALDCSTLDAVGRYLPALREVESGSRTLLPGKLSALFDLRLQQWRKVLHIENPEENDKVAARATIEGLPAGSLILADLGYFGFAWFDDLQERGHYWISRVRAKTSYKLLHRYYEHGETLDALIWLGKYEADKAAYAVRLVQFRVGGTLYRYVTNVLDPRQLPMREVAVLYARRWDIEMAFRAIKQHLGLHLLWSAKSVVVLQQVWAVLTIVQILWALRQEVAGRAGVDPLDVSLPLLIEYMPQAAIDGHDPIAWFVEVGREARFIRPSKRTMIQAPEIPLAKLQALPPDLELVRQPRYANRNCASRKTSGN